MTVPMGLLLLGRHRRRARLAVRAAATALGGERARTARLRGHVGVVSVVAADLLAGAGRLVAGAGRVVRASAGLGRCSAGRGRLGAGGGLVGLGALGRRDVVVVGGLLGRVVGRLGGRLGGRLRARARALGSALGAALDRLGLARGLAGASVADLLARGAQGCWSSSWSRYGSCSRSGRSRGRRRQ